MEFDDFVTNARPYVYKVISQVPSTGSSVVSLARSFIMHGMSVVAPALSASQIDLVSILLVLMIFYFSLLILQNTARMMYRTVVMFSRILIYLFILALAFNVYSNGLVGTYQNIVIWYKTR